MWPLGGVGERFRVVSANDEGCSEADWLRLNLRLWELTGQTRFLDSAERLIWNHYAMNRTANGGYGHHVFVSDAQGPLLMQPQFTEAVWCCTFHGVLGMHTLKSHLVVGSPKGVFVNFPVEVSASVRTAQGRWKVSVVSQESGLGELQCRVRLDPLEGATGTPELFVRRPQWASRVTVADRAGKRLPAREEAGYLRLSVRSGFKGEASFSFVAAPRVEDRRMRPVALDSKIITRHAGVTLSIGPHLLLANASKPRPVLVARVGRDGSLLLPAFNRFPRVDRLAATAEEITQAQTRLQFTPWAGVDRKAPAAFVFDLIAVPEDFPVANALR